MFGKTRHIHFVGIGGSGMSGIAEVLIDLGYVVTGSDLRESATTKHLRDVGATVMIGHDEKNIRGAQVVVASTAVSAFNPEVRAAEGNRIPVIPRAEMLAELMRLKQGVAIAGAHGKTTTTSMLAAILADSHLDPTIVIGGRVNAFGGGSRSGQGSLLIAEADESDGTFLKLSPSIVVVTNIDREHLDYYKSLDKILESFSQFVEKVPFYGLVVLCSDDPLLRSLIPSLHKRCVTYGMQPHADLVASEVELGPWKSTFTVHAEQRLVGKFTIPLPGRHYVANALAAIAVSLELDIPVKQISDGLAGFRGVERRLQRIGEKSGVLLLDDYAHHPTEIRATVAAVKEGWGRRLIVLFQPHRFSRTRDLMDDFAVSFDGVDALFVTEIYSAGEDPIDGVSGARLVEHIKKMSRSAVSFVADSEAIVEQVVPMLREGDIVLTMGAGDIWKVGQTLTERLS